MLSLMIGSLQLLWGVDDLQDFNASAWSKVFGDSEYQFIRDEDDTQVNRSLGSKHTPSGGEGETSGYVCISYGLIGSLVTLCNHHALAV